MKNQDTNKPKNLVVAVQTIVDVLEPLEEANRRRVISSVMSLLGESASAIPMIAAANIPPAALAPELPKAAVAVGPLGRRVSPVELIQEKKPATISQKIALFAYYREKHEGLSRFSRGDLETYFAKAKEAPPGNYGRDFAVAVKSGWIHEDGADSYLTSKGLEAVEAGFEGKAAPRGKSAGKR